LSLAHIWFASDEDIADLITLMNHRGVRTGTT
jgi:hypothetical protein